MSWVVLVHFGARDFRWCARVCTCVVVFRGEKGELGVRPVGLAQGRHKSKGRPRTPPGAPKMPSRTPLDGPKCPPGPPWTAQKAFPKHLALDFFPKRLFVQRSSEKSENSKSSKTSRKKSRQRSSAVVNPHNPAQKSKELSQRSDPQRVAAVVARSALQ